MVQMMIVFLAVFSFGVVSYFVFMDNANDKKPVDKKKLCNLADDQAYFEIAIVNGDRDQCQCMKDTNTMQTCVASTEQAILYREAITQVDERICEGLVADVQREACLSVVKAKTEYLQKENKEQLSQTYLYNHNDEKAIAVLNDMLIKDQNDVASLISISFAYANQVIYGSLDEKQINDNNNKALSSAKKAQKLDPKNPEAYRAEGFALEAAGELEKALDVYVLALEEFPQDVLLLNGRGHVESMLGYVRSAIETFELAVSIDADVQYSAPLMNLCRLQAGDSSLFDNAVRNCQKLVDANNSSSNEKSEALQIMAQILLMQKKTDQALDKLQYARTLAPMNDNVYVTLAGAYNQKENGIMAEEMANKALTINDIKTVAYYELAHARFQQKKNSEAIIAAENGLRVVDEDVSLLLPNKPRVKMDLYYLLADIYSTQNDQESMQRYKLLGDENASILNLNSK